MGGNDLVHGVIELSDSTAELDHRWGRQMAKQRRNQHANAGAIAHEDVHGGRNFADLLSLYIEERTHYDAQCELHHFLMDVARFAVAPCSEQSFRVVGHDFRVGSNSLAMKSGLGQTALPQPGLAFVGEESVAKEPATLADDPIFQEILIITDQHRLDQVRMIKEVNVEPSGTIIENVTVLAGPFPEYCKRIRAGERHVSNRESRLGTGRALHRKG